MGTRCLESTVTPFVIVLSVLPCAADQPSAGAGQHASEHALASCQEVVVKRGCPSTSRLKRIVERALRDEALQQDQGSCRECPSRKGPSREFKVSLIAWAAKLHDGAPPSTSEEMILLIDYGQTASTSRWALAYLCTENPYTWFSSTDAGCTDKHWAFGHHLTGALRPLKTEPDAERIVRFVEASPFGHKNPFAKEYEVHEGLCWRLPATAVLKVVAYEPSPELLDCLRRGAKPGHEEKFREIWRRSLPKISIAPALLRH